MDRKQLKTGKHRVKVFRHQFCEPFYRKRVRGLVVDGEFLRMRRLSCGLTQDQLAKQCGINQDYIARLESGKRKVMAKATVENISKALNTTSDKIAFKGYESEETRNSISLDISLKYPLTADQVCLVHQFARLLDEENEPFYQK